MIHTGMKVIKDGLELRIIHINSKDIAILSDGNMQPVSELNEIGNDCWLDKEPFFQCCCKCIYRVNVHLHCHDEHDRKGCICKKHVGFACAGFEDENIIQANWPEHSVGCELYTTKEVAEKWKK